MTCRTGKMKLGHRRLGQNARNRWNSAVATAPWQLIINQRVERQAEVDRTDRMLDRALVRDGGLVGVTVEPLGPMSLAPGAINNVRIRRASLGKKARGVPRKAAAPEIVWGAVRIVFSKIRKGSKKIRKVFPVGKGRGEGRGFGDRVLDARRRRFAWWSDRSIPGKWKGGPR